ncbi:SDR family NAD(P)-dependent oxidoreductase [Pseudomonas sp. O230]|uniref:SDR family NAD(P)-dependent oxidoreductase n=1 Tax=Pseudomonas sp. O230 TaxID=3159450 RepID=UPI00387B7806
MSNDTKSVVVVTGAGSGIGQSVAIEFSKLGYFVVGADQNILGLQRTTELAGGEGNFHSIQVDVRNESNMEAVFAYVKQSKLLLHAVAACAGVARSGVVDTLSETDWDFTMNVNVKGVWLTAKYAMPIFVAQRSGAFIAIGSDASLRGASGYGAYCASKHAVLGLVRCLALDYGHLGVRSNIVCPGFVQTPMMDKLFEEAADPAAEMSAYAKEVPLGRFALPLEIAKVIIHLASAESSYTNGAIYSIDGGVTAGHFG